MQQIIDTMAGRMTTQLEDYKSSFYIFGSIALEDYRPGWSDIDFLCLLERPLSLEAAEAILMLRQTLVEETGERAYRTFEGLIVSWDGLSGQTDEPIVYWGTSGQRIDKHIALDPFSVIVLKQSGRLIKGDEQRQRIALPSPAQLRGALEQTYATIRKYGKGGDNLYAAGWMLDTARCLYTLETGGIMGKTQAGRWALETGLVPEPWVMQRVLEIRSAPLEHDDSETKAWLGSLTPHIQAFADVLEAKLIKTERRQC